MTQIGLLENINSQVSEMSHKLNETRDMVIRLDATDIPTRLKSIETRTGKVENRVTRVETRSAVIVAGLSIFISGVVSVMSGVFKTWFS